MEAVETDRSNGGHADKAGVGEIEGEGEEDALRRVMGESGRCNDGVSAMMMMTTQYFLPSLT